MRLIFVLLLLASCGKKIASTPLEPLPPEMLAQDTDADGVGDLYEISTGRDPLVADVTANLEDIEGVLVNESQLYSSFKIKSTLRDLLIQADATVLTDLPTGEFFLDVSAEQNFWASYLSGQFFTQHQLIYQNNQNSKPIATSLAHLAKAQFPLENLITPSELEKLQLENYRLIVSTPKEDRVFWIHQSLSIREFTDRYLKSILKPIAGLTWKMVNLPKQFETIAQPGMSYGLVQTTQMDSMLSRLHSRTQLRDAATLIEVPATQELQFTLVMETPLHTLTHCQYDSEMRGNQGNLFETWTLITVGSQAHPFQSFLEALNFLDLSELSENKIEILWHEVHSNGIAIRLRYNKSFKPRQLRATNKVFDTIPFGPMGDRCRKGTNHTKSTFRWDSLYISAF